MSYETVVEQVKAAPEECLDEISVVIEKIVNQHERQQNPSVEAGLKWLNSFAGSVPQNISIEQARDEYLKEKYGDPD